MSLNKYFAELQEKLKASDSMSDWIHDFENSDAPQFRGKSPEKRRQMAIAAKLSSERGPRNEETDRDPVSAFASNAHEEWRAGWRKQNDGKSVPRVKKNSDGSEGDINVPFNQLHPDWQKENLAAGKAARDAVTKHPNDMEKAAEHVHNEWMKRNPKQDYNASQHVPYSELPEEEKEKDRVHVRTMQNLMNTNEETYKDTGWKKPERNPGAKTKNVAGRLARKAMKQTEKETKKVQEENKAYRAQDAESKRTTGMSLQQRSKMYDDIQKKLKDQEEEYRKQGILPPKNESHPDVKFQQDMTAKEKAKLQHLKATDARKQYEKDRLKTNEAISQDKKDELRSELGHEDHLPHNIYINKRFWKQITGPNAGPRAKKATETLNAKGKKATYGISEDVNEGIGKTIGRIAGQYAGSKLGMEGPGAAGGELLGHHLEYHTREFVKKLHSVIKKHLSGNPAPQNSSFEYDDSNLINELDEPTLTRFVTRARFSSNPNRRKAARQAMEKLKKKQEPKNEEVELEESHFKVGQKVKCIKSGMTGKVIKTDKPETGKYYTVKQDSGKTMKYAPDELKALNEEERDSNYEKVDMAKTQAHFIKYAAEEILEYLDMGGEIEEWYQNKLSKVHSDVEGLHSWMEGNKRKEGMVEAYDHNEHTEKSNAKLYNKAAKSKKHQEIAPNVHFSKSTSIYDPHETSFKTSSGQHGYATHQHEGGYPTQKDVHDDIKRDNPHIKDSKTIKAVASAVHAHIRKNKLNDVNEEVEELDEVLDTAGKFMSYTTKAAASGLKSAVMGTGKFRKRQAGIQRAVYKAKEKINNEEVEELEETPRVDRGLSDEDKVAVRASRGYGGRPVNPGNTSGGQFRGKGPSPYKDSNVAKTGERKGMITKSAIDRTKENIKSRLNMEEVEELEEGRFAREFNKRNSKERTYGAWLSQTWKNDANDRGHTVETIPHPKGHDAEYYIAKNKEGNKVGHYDMHSKRGKLSEEVGELEEDGKLKGGAKDPCWKGYQMIGTKKKGGREVPNCVPREETELKTFKALREKVNGDSNRS